MAQHVIKLQGSFTPGWAARLCAGLAARRMNIVSGAARRVTASGWEAELRVELLDAAVDPAAIDYHALARQPGRAGAGGSVRVTRYRIERTATDLEVEIRGPDAVGFLERILDVFALFVLFPREMTIETVGDEVRDRFRLQGMGGAAPSDEVGAALAARLEGMTRP